MFVMSEQRDSLKSMNLPPTRRPPQSLERPESELVFALVGAVGTDLERFQQGLIEQLAQYGYGSIPIKMSELIRREQNLEGVHFTNDYERTMKLMTAGTELREEFGRGDIVALHAIRRIYEQRADWEEGDIPERDSFPFYPPKKPFEYRAFIINSLKHPDEANLLRNVYGPGFFLISVHVPEQDRRHFLVNRRRMTDAQARELIERDRDETGRELGQKTSDVFHRADAFVRFRSDENTNKELVRFLDLVFGDPFQTPTEDEHAMFLAFAASLRSGSLARQVGAAVASSTGEIVGVGANDVPKFGGGLYWPDENDQRDHVLEYDSNDVRREEIVADVARRLMERFVTAQTPTVPPEKADEIAADLERSLSSLKLDNSELARFLQAICNRDVSPIMAEVLRRALLQDITEYGRAVHAEMEALLSCARSGISPKGGTLYCTTFPCHNCAKHIVAAGIERLVYVEPYAKSRATDLHGDALSVDADEVGKLKCEPFVGIGPRRYFDLFSMTLGRGYDISRKNKGIKLTWRRDRRSDVGYDGREKKHKPGPRVPMLPSSYVHREWYVSHDLQKLMEKREKRREIAQLEFELHSLETGRTNR
jgi:deoxycytidylate deaminase